MCRLTNKIGKTTKTSQTTQTTKATDTSQTSQTSKSPNTLLQIRFYNFYYKEVICKKVITPTKTYS